mgnify:CR=1 FL=1
MNFLSEMGEGMQLPVIQNEHVKILIGRKTWWRS